MASDGRSAAVAAARIDALGLCPPISCRLAHSVCLGGFVEQPEADYKVFSEYARAKPGEAVEGGRLVV